MTAFAKQFTTVCGLKQHIQWQVLTSPNAFHRPNYQADIVVLDDPYDVKIHQVIKKGHLISNHDFNTQPLSFAKNTMNFSLSPADLQLPLNSATANIIQVIPNHIETEHLVEPISIHNGNFCPDTVKGSWLNATTILAKSAKPS